MAARSRKNSITRPSQRIGDRLMKTTFVSCRVTQKNIRESKELTKTLEKFEQEKQGSIRKIQQDLERIKEFKRDLALSSSLQKEEERWPAEQLGQSDILLSKQRNINKMNASLVQAWDPMNQQSANQRCYDDDASSKVKDVEDISLDDNLELYTTHRLFTPKTRLDYKDLFAINEARDNEKKQVLSSINRGHTSPFLTRKLLSHTKKPTVISADSANLLSPQTHRTLQKTFNKQVQNTKEKDIVKQTEPTAENNMERRPSYRSPVLTNIRPFLSENPVRYAKTISLTKALSDDDVRDNKRRGAHLMRRRSTMPLITSMKDINLSLRRPRLDRNIPRTDKHSTLKRTMSTGIPTTPTLMELPPSPIRKQSLTYSGSPW